MKGVVFRSKVDAWVAVVIYISAAITVGAIVLSIIVGPLLFAVARRYSFPQ